MQKIKQLTDPKINMKKPFTPFPPARKVSLIVIARLLFILLLTAGGLSLNSNAQNWGTPINVEIPNGTGGDAGQYSSLLVVNGNPAMSYYDATRHDLIYIRATDASGTAWAAPVSIDVVGDVGQYTSLQIVNGNPAIAYYDLTNQDLKYVRALDADGVAWAAPVAVDVIGSVGEYTSLQIVNGNPAISYYDYTNKNLKYTRATDASGTTWASPVSIDFVGVVGQYTYLQIVNGNPAIAYYDLTYQNLKYVRALDVSGTAWASPISVDVTGDVGEYTSLQIVSGNPAISYYDATNGNLKYVRATDASGTAWAVPFSVDVTGEAGRYTSLQIVNGNPAISYCDGGTLKYVRAMDSSGTVWAAPISVDVTNSNVQFTSLQIVNGNPAISYYDATNENLKYVRATDASGTAWPAAINICSGFIGWFTSLQVVNGNPAVSYFDESSGTGGCLKYVRASDASGTAWTAPLSIDVTTSTIGVYSSLQVVNGNPAISYYDWINRKLKYVRASDASGTAWAAPIFIDTTGSVGWCTSLQIVNGNPAVSYYDWTNGNLKYVRATDASGMTWAAPVSIDGGTADVGYYTTLQIVNGNPAVSYYDNTNFDVKYVRATDASGTTWDPPLTIYAPGIVGQFTSMVPMGAGAGVAYYNESEAYPYFIFGAPCTTTNPAVLSNLSASVGTICFGNSTTLSASGTLNDATNWQWYSASCGGTYLGNGISITVSPTVSTTYFARGEGGCVTPGACASFTVTVNSLSSLSISGIGNICNGSSTILTASGALYYLWSTGATTSTINISTANSYSVIGTDGNNCSNTSAMTVNVNLLPNVTTNLNGVVITATQTGAVYQWLDCNNSNLPIAGATNKSYTVTANGNYAVAVTMNSCSDTSACVNVNSVGILQPVLSEVEGGVRFYPNPTNGIVNLACFLDKQSDIFIKIMSVNGQIIYSHNSKSVVGEYKHSIDMTGYAKGMYYIQIITAGETVTKKFAFD